MNSDRIVDEAMLGLTILYCLSNMEADVSENHLHVINCELVLK